MAGGAHGAFRQAKRDPLAALIANAVTLHGFYRGFGGGLNAGHWKTIVKLLDGLLFYRESSWGETAESSEITPGYWLPFAIPALLEQKVFPSV
jgi:hypothetical protein